jgi:hypothetical protein
MPFSIALAVDGAPAAGTCHQALTCEFSITAEPGMHVLEAAVDAGHYRMATIHVDVDPSVADDSTGTTAPPGDDTSSGSDTSGSDGDTTGAPQTGDGGCSCNAAADDDRGAIMLAFAACVAWRRRSRHRAVRPI